MYIQRRFPFKSVLVWTKRELIFFVILATAYTIFYELLGIKWLQVPLTPVGLIGTAVAFMIGFQNNAAYDRIWEARKIWGGIVNTSRSLIITVKESFYMHRVEANQDESEEPTKYHMEALRVFRRLPRLQRASGGRQTPARR